MAKCPVNQYRISATDLGNSQSRKTCIFACNLIKIPMAKICSQRWRIIFFMLVFCVHCRTNLSTGISARPSLWGALIEPEGSDGFVCEEEDDVFICTIMMTPLKAHIHTIPSFLSSWNEVLCQLLFPLVLGVLFQCTGYAKSMSNEQCVLHPIPAHTWWTGSSETHSGIHGTVTELVPHGLTLKTLFISLCLPFPFCRTSVIIQAIFH